MYINLGHQGSSVLRLEEARKRDQLHKVNALNIMIINIFYTDLGSRPCYITKIYCNRKHVISLFSFPE